MTFGEKLTIARKEKNLSPEELAQKLYVTRQAISRWENNSTQPSLEMLSVICLELEKTPNDFIDTPQKILLVFTNPLRSAKNGIMLWSGAEKIS